MPTGLPDCTSSVSSFSRAFSEVTMAWEHSQLRAAGSAIDHEVLRAFRRVGIEIVHQHAHGGFLPPTFAGELVAARRFNGNIGRTGHIGCDWHDSKMVAVASGQLPVVSCALQYSGYWLRY